MINPLFDADVVGALPARVLRTGCVVLVPYAARGTLIDALRARAPNITIIATEPEAKNARVLVEKGYAVSHNSFLGFDAPMADAIILRPPFRSKTYSTNFAVDRDLDVLAYAFQKLKPDGALLGFFGERFMDTADVLGFRERGSIRDYVVKGGRIEPSVRNFVCVRYGCEPNSEAIIDRFSEQVGWQR